jgi:hypothetical protein
VRQDVQIQEKRKHTGNSKKIKGDERNISPKQIHFNEENLQHPFSKSRRKRPRRPKGFDRRLKKQHSTKTTGQFQCEKGMKGVYADLKTSCQRFFMCQPNGREEVFTCPLGTLFNQEHGVCDWAKKVNCSKTLSRI